MSEIPEEPGLSSCFSFLTPEGRAVVDRWCRLINVPTSAWPHVPPLRSLVVTAAVLRLAGELEEEEGMPRSRALDAAVVSLVGDETDRDGWAGERIARRVRRWRARAREAGENVLPPEGDAA